MGGNESSVSARSLVEYNPPNAARGRQVGFYDCTLRDGEQAPGLVLNRGDKLAIARMLDRVGVDRIEVGMPVVSPEDRAAAADIVAAGLDAELWGFSRSVKGDVDACLEVGLRRLVIEAPTSAQKLHAYGLSRDTVLARIAATLEYAVGAGAYVAFFAVDATRTDEAFLAHAFRTAAAAGAAEIVLADTLSVLAPEGVAALTRKAREWTDLPVMIHCHNDFGLATACTLAGVQAGASFVHVTVNGIGEKAGNADIAEVAFALDVLLGCRTHVKLDLLPELAQLGEQLSRFPLPFQKPVVGRLAFTRESGAVIAQLVTYPPAVEAYDPRIVGRSTDVMLGKKSGKASIQYVAQALGLPPLSDAEAEGLATAVKRLSIEKKGPVLEEEFAQLVERLRRGELVT